MPKAPLFSTYRQGENRVTGSLMAVFERIDLSKVERLLAAASGESALQLFSFENQVRSKRLASVPDARISASFSLWFETKTAPGQVRQDQLRQQTGWRLGWAIADPALLAMINKMLEPLISCPSSVSQQAGVAALTGTQQPVDVMRTAYRKRRDLAAEILEPAGMLPVRPSGAFYALVDLRETGMNGRDLALCLLQEKRVATAPGDTFGKVLETGFVRISLASSDEDVAEGCRRLIAFRDEHRN